MHELPYPAMEDTSQGLNCSEQTREDQAQQACKNQQIQRTKVVSDEEIRVSG